MDIQGSVYLGDYLREGQGCAGLKQESWAGVGMGVEGEDGGGLGGGSLATHTSPSLCTPALKLSPKGSATTAVVFPAPSPKGQAVGGRVVLRFPVLRLGWHPASSSRSLALPPSLFWAE